MGHHYTTDTWNSLEEGRHIFTGEMIFVLLFANNEDFIWGQCRKRKTVHFRETQFCYFAYRIQLVKPIDVHLEILGERPMKVQSEGRGCLVARSGVQSRWLRFTLIVNHISCFPHRCFYELNGARVFLIKTSSFISQTDNRWKYAEFKVWFTPEGNEMKSLFPKPWTSM